LLLLLLLVVVVVVVVVLLLHLLLVVNMIRGIIQTFLLWKPKNEDVERKEVHSYTITHIPV
jgi:hypothetical protein